MYKIWATQGQDGCDTGIEFETLADAIEYCDIHASEASFGIKLPDETWYSWDGIEVR